MAQPSSSAAANSDHDVFINHRGPDAKKTFASHLYNRLSLHGLRVFLDDPELRRGDDFSVQIINAIGSASVHVAIFSRGYADSYWCLKELVEMLDTKAPIIPVFYHVKPDELRGTRGKKRTCAEALDDLASKTDNDGKKKTYAEALDDLASKTDYDGQTPRHDPSKIQKWREALRQVANISGFELEACNGDEGELLEKVVVEVLERVKKPALLRDVAKHPTGLDEKAEDFEIFLSRQQQRGKHQIWGIWGLGGIGKTTLATEFFNRKTSDYSRSCFLSDVKDKKGNDLISLQKKLLQMLNVPSPEIDRVTDDREGIRMIRKHLSSVNCLVIIDDVDHEDQVHALLPHQTVHHSDSLILITSRNRQVLINSNVEEECIYPLTILSEEYSRELFCLHSFNQSYPPQGFEFLVNKFVEACGGLPLSLKVFGARLRGKSKAVWEEQLNKPLPIGIKQILQISYNALEEEEEKEIFLDIACFFIGEDRDRVIRIVGESGFQNIVDRCLVDVDREKRIKMHDHVRDMGRELAKGSGLPGRLWRWTKEDNDDLLRKSLNGQITDVRGVRIDFRDYTEVDDDGEDEEEDGEDEVSEEEDEDGEDEDGEEEDEDGEDEVGLVDEGIRMSSLQFLDAEGDLMERILTKVSSPKLKWLRWTKSGWFTRSLDSSPGSLPPSIPRWVPMKNLRVLQIEGHRLKTLWEEELEPPLQLRELEIKGSLSHIPNSIGQLNHLERIVICGKYSEQVSITKLPEEFCFLRSLKVLVLEGWSRMKALPNCFGDLTELQHIQLPSCTALDSLPESFGNLTNLHHLQLSQCSALKRLPESFGKLTNLQHVDLSYCRTLERLPESFGNLTNLHHLQLSQCSTLKRLPESFGKLTNLQHVDLSYCGTLERLPDSFGKLIKLQHLHLRSCFKLSLQRETLGNISTLKYIDLTYCRKIKVLPSQVAHQRSLEQLRLDGTNLKELPSAIGELSCMEVLKLGEGPLLDKLPFQLYDLKKLKELSIYRWQELKVLPDALCDLKNLKELSIMHCKKLKCLPRLLGNLSNLNKLEIVGSDELNWLPTSIGWLTQLTELRVSRCPLIRELPLKEEVGGGKSETLNDFQILPRLQVLDVSETGISEVSFAEGVCCNLQSLSIGSCNNMVEVGKLPNTLLHLSYISCHNLRRIDQLHGLAELISLDIRDCIELEELPSIETLICLRDLTAGGCVKLKRIRGLGQLTKLKNLYIRGCSALEELEDIQNCIRLRALYAAECVKLKNIRGLGQLKKLRTLYIEGCSDLEEVEGIQHCTSLDKIVARGCPKLQLDAGVKEQLCQRCEEAVFE